MAQQQINPGSAPVIWSDIASAFETVNDNFTELYASVGGDAVDFTSLGTSLVPRTTELYDLGSNTKKWRDLWLSGSSIHLGDAVITATGTTVNLPVGSTIGGLRVDENYFKFISVAGQSTIEADDGTDTLTVASGNSGITVTTDASTDTLTITNSGVTSLAGTAGQIGVSQSTGGITLTNLGVTSTAAGQGISLTANTGAVTIANTGVIDLDAGIGIQLSPRDPVTGIITITNSQPNIPQQTFSIISVPAQTPLAADSTGDTLNIEVSGDGLSITTAPLTDTLTFTNTGVTSLAVGSGLTINAGTGAINLTLDATLNRNIVGDVTGSVFADDSTVLVDAVDGKIRGNVDTSTVNISGGLYFGNDRYAIFEDEGGDFTIVGYGYTTPGDIYIKTDQTGLGQKIFKFDTVGDLTVDGSLRAPAGTVYSKTGYLGYSGLTDLDLVSVAGNVTIQAGEEIGPYFRLTTDGILDLSNTNTVIGFVGDITGSVFADDSTKLVDAVEAKIVGDIENQNINTTTIRPASGVLVIDANGGTANIISGVNGGIYVTDASVATAVQGDISLYSITSGQIDIGTQGTANGVNIGRAGITTTIYGTLNATITGDVIGSVFADDSTLLINGVDGTINASALTGALPAIDGSALTGVIATSVDWTDVANTPTTISGYGITDAATSAQGSLADSAIQPADLGSFTFIGSTLDTSDSSGISVTPAVTFNSDVIVENELYVGGSKFYGVNELKALAAASSDFADFQARIAAL